MLRRGKGELTSEEYRALQADSDTAGGYLVMPRMQSSQLIKAVDDLVFIAGLASIEEVTEAQSLGIASLDADPDDGEWTTEIKAASFDSSMAFGDRELTPRPLVKGIKVSTKLLRLSKDAEAIVRDRLQYKFALTQEKAFLTGSGSGRPLGVFTASTSGISTARDFSTGNTSTAIGGDGLIEAKYGLKARSWPKAQWAFHRDAMKQIAKLKDVADGQYLWQPGLQMGQPDRLLSFPVNVTEHAPNTFTSGLYVESSGTSHSTRSLARWTFLSRS